MLVLVLVLVELPWPVATTVAAWAKKRQRGEGMELLVELGCPWAMEAGDETRVPPLLQVLIQYATEYEHRTGYSFPSEVAFR